MKDRISVVIAYETPFMASSVERLLTDKGFDMIADVTGVSRIDDLGLDRSPDICIFGCHSQGIDEVCEWLRDQFRESRVVLLDTSDRVELTRIAASQRLDGCVSLDLSPDLIAASLRLVNEGVLVFPDAAMKASNDTMRSCGAQLSSLTPREAAVLELIGQGMANKVIARKLDISESTVKAHLNSVLRKTGTSNRTEAARWAFEHGRVA